MSIPNILKKIIQFKLEEVQLEKTYLSEFDLDMQIRNLDQTRSFRDQLLQCKKKKIPCIIAEIKKASPSKGVLRRDFNPVSIAKNYENYNAACLSVLTDKKFFHGCHSFINKIKTNVSLPILRKDFIVDPYQIKQSRLLGADCILLIASVLDSNQIGDYIQLAKELNLDVLVEIHTLKEFESVSCYLDDCLLGINNRNLHTFEVDLFNTIKIKNHIKKNFNIDIITESGIHSKKDVDLMLNHGVNNFLVGEALMVSDNPGRAMKDLFFNK